MPITIKHGKLYMKDASGNLMQIVPDTSPLVPDYQGATASSAGSAGLVPAATAAQRDLYLKGDGTWGEGPYGTTVALGSNDSFIEPIRGSVFTKTVAAATSFTFDAVPVGKACVFTLILTNGGNYAVTWPSSVKWSGGNIPNLTENGIDILTFLTADGGTTWYGSVSVFGAA